MILDAVLYVAIAIALYVAADRIVGLLERRMGHRIGNRSLLFLIVVLALLVVGLTLLGIPRFSGVP